MENNIKEILELGRAAVIFIKNGKIIHMNSSAISLLGKDYCGETPIGLLPDYLLAGSSACFTSGATINGRNFCAQVKIIDDVRYVFLEEEKNPGTSFGILNKALLADMLSTLFNIGIAIDRLGNEAKSGSKVQTDYLSILNHNYYCLRHALSNLSSAISLREGTLPFRFGVTDLAKLCSDIVSTVSLICSGKGIDIEYSSRHTELFAYADSEKIERILLNLISNSLAHTPKGGKISIILEKSGNTAYISVNDTGCGIAPQDMARLFTAYERQPDLSSPDSFKGGLGLGIARALAEAHDGALLVESRKGEGCSVRIILPLKTERFNVFESPGIDYVNLGMSLILTELATVLDSECYSEKFLD